jgi:hypothetical protein
MIFTSTNRSTRTTRRLPMDEDEEVIRDVYEQEQWEQFLEENTADDDDQTDDLPCQSHDDQP